MRACERANICFAGKVEVIHARVLAWTVVDHIKGA
jgi:hypothetical protein